MSDLTAALDALDSALPNDAEFPAFAGALKMAVAAARRQLPLEPVECGTCGGVGESADTFITCTSCDGRGWTYQPGTVEAVAEAIHGEPWADISSKDRPYVVDQAVAVLDALRTLGEEEEKG